MSERVIYEYSILRYVPDLERGEFINVGLIMMCKRARWIRCELKIDAARIKALCPKADLQCLEHQLAAFQDCDIPDPTLPVEERYRWMVAAKSAIIQASPSHPGLIPADALDAQFNTLFNRLVNMPNELTKAAIDEARSGRLHDTTPVDTSSVEAMFKSAGL